ncbi:energy transducer TonB [Crocinitomix sp.]|nr:energy transducer TonB [Crocinitomix sp.]
MRSFRLYALLVSFQLTFAFGQNVDTIFFNADWEKTWDPTQYEYYRVYNKELLAGVYSVNDYYLTGELQMTGQFQDSKHRSRTGHFIWYHQNGQKEREADYFKGEKNGEYIEWYESGQMETYEEYENGKPINNSKYWYESGQLKQLKVQNTASELDSIYTWWENGNKKEIGTVVNLYTQYIKLDSYWTEAGQQTVNNGQGNLISNYSTYSLTGQIVNGLRHGSWIKKDSLNNIKGELKFKQGEFIKGYITDHGYKDKFDSWEREPEYPKNDMKGMVDYIQKNLSFDCDETIYNVVYVRFVINQIGDVEQISIVKGNTTACQFEKIEQMLERMPHWTPAIQGGEYVRVRFTLPINYRE